MGSRSRENNLSDLSLGPGEALRVEDVMRLLHLSKNTVYKLAREGAIPSYRVGRQIRFRSEDVMAHVQATSLASTGAGYWGPASQTAAPTGPNAGVGGATQVGAGVSGGPGRPTGAASGARGGSSAAAPSPAAGSAPGLAPGSLATTAGVGFDGWTSAGVCTPIPDVLDEPPAWMHGSLVVGGQDLVCDVFANYVASVGVRAVRSQVNGYVSLARMYLGTVHATTISLWSEEEGRYNIPYVREMLPGVSVVVFRLCRRRVGFTVPRKTAVRVERWSDLLGPEVRIANRERGAAARVLLDEKMAYLEARPSDIAGYDRVVTSEFAQALLVARGMANVAITSEKPFRQIDGLDFLPMQDEVVDLAVVRTPQTAGLLKATRNLLHTDAFRSEFDPTLYDTRSMGDVVFEA